MGHRITGDRRDCCRGAAWEYVHVAVDDASRLAFVEVLASEQADATIRFLRRALAFYRSHGIRDQRVVTDNGSAYESHLFARLCSDCHLRHIRTRPYTPRTNGKTERFIQTMQREWAYFRPYRSSRKRIAALPRWLTYYNHRRHMEASTARLPSPGCDPVMNNVSRTHT